MSQERCEDCDGLLWERDNEIICTNYKYGEKYHIRGLRNCDWIMDKRAFWLIHKAHNRQRNTAFLLGMGLVIILVLLSTKQLLSWPILIAIPMIIGGIHTYSISRNLSKLADAFDRERNKERKNYE